MLRRLLALFVAVLALTSCGSAGSSSGSASTDAPAVTSSSPGRSTTALAPRPTAVPGVTAPAGMKVVTPDQLPKEARTTLHLIEQGGPFPYDKDGSTFQNREGLLPKKPNGYYREYTVDTPGSDDRGARRIITGKQDEAYYTPDHYASFWWVVT